MSDYYQCANEIGKCKGLGKGIKTFHACAKRANCGTNERKKLERLKKKITERKASKVIKKVIKKATKANIKVPIVKPKPKLKNRKLRRITKKIMEEDARIKKLASKPAPVPAPAPAPKRKPRPKISQKDIEDQKAKVDGIYDDIDFPDVARANKRGELDFTIIQKGCDRVKLISRLFKKFKTNNYKPRSVTSDEFDKILPSHLVRFYRKHHTKNKSFAVPVLESVIKIIDDMNKEKNNYKKDCGLEESNIISRLQKEINEDSKKIRSSITRSRSKIVKNIPFPEILLDYDGPIRQDVINELVKKKKLDRDVINNLLTEQEQVIYIKFFAEKQKAQETKFEEGRRRRANASFEKRKKERTLALKTKNKK